MEKSNKFRSLRLEGWRQFGHVDLELHPRLTVITGANGAGKSSLLRIFSSHFGFGRPFLATPVRNPEGSYSYFTGIFNGGLNRVWKAIFSADHGKEDEIGKIEYTNENQSSLRVPEQSAVQFSVSIHQQQRVAGIHIDSHQPISQFQQVGQIPTTIIRPSSAYENYNNELKSRYNGGNTGMSPTYKMKEAIIAMALFGEGNSHVQGNSEILNAYKGFVETLRKILPESLGFIDLAVRPPEVVLVTKSGDFLIDASSGGLMTLIDLAWRLYMFSLNNNEFVVTMDEPENHLHPTLQRSLMRQLLSAFPTAQFIIATHSPFMVSAVRDSNVYVLRYRDSATGELEGEVLMDSQKSRVVSERLDTVNKAGTAGEILREVLGVSATIPEWVEEGLEGVVNRFRDSPITLENLTKLRAELNSLGYSELYPDAVAALTEGR